MNRLNNEGKDIILKVHVKIQQSIIQSNILTKSSIKKNGVVDMRKGYWWGYKRSNEKSR
jgi:hypothetical protein